MASSACPGWQQIEWCLYVDGQHDLVTGSAQEVTFVQKEASLLTWKFGRERGDGGRASYTTAILCEDQICGAFDFFSFLLFLFSPARFLATSLFLHTQSFPFASTVSLVMYTSSWLAVFLCFYETARGACM